MIVAGNETLYLLKTYTLQFETVSSERLPYYIIAYHTENLPLLPTALKFTWLRFIPVNEHLPLDHTTHERQAQEDS